MNKRMAEGHDGWIGFFFLFGFLFLSPLSIFFKHLNAVSNPSSFRPTKVRGELPNA